MALWYLAALAAMIAACEAAPIMIHPINTEATLPDFPLFLQCDPRWGTSKMGVDGPGERATICREGCAMTSLSMALAGFGIDVNPGSLNQWLETHSGYRCDAGDCNNLVLDAVQNLTGRLSLISEAPAPTAEVMQGHLLDGDTIYLAHVHNRSHFVLITSWNETIGAFNVRDPFFNTTSYAHDQIADVIAYAVHNDSEAGAHLGVPGATLPRHASSADLLRDLPKTAVVPHPYPLFKQCNASWGQDIMTSTTLCKVGCLESSTSMALGGHSILIDGNNSDPGVLNTWLRANHGYTGDNMLDEAAVPKINSSLIAWPADGMHTQNDLTIPEIHNYLESGRPVIANVMNGHHFVLVVGYDSSDTDVLYIHDSGFDRATYSRTKDVVGWRLYEMHTQE